MVPRPRPEDTLLFQASADDKPYLHDSSSNNGRGGRRRSSLLSAWDANKVEDPEDHLDSSSIELTTCTSTSSGDDDPLLSSGGVSDILAQSEEAACRHDGQIAALMAAQWNKQARKRRQEILNGNRDQNRADKDWTLLQRIGCIISGIVITILAFSLLVFSIQNNGFGNKKTSYVCPATLEDIVGGLNSTQLCADAVDCTCEDPTVPRAVEPAILEAESKEMITSSKSRLDVVFLGQLFDSHHSEWMEDGFSAAQMGSQGEQPSTILYRLNHPQQPVPSSPKVWWIALGSQDLLDHKCSLDAVQAGVAKVVEQILEQQPDAHIILSPFSSSDAGILASLNERLQCIASTNGSNVEYMNPFVSQLDEEDDDDFFVDVSSASTTKTVVSNEEAQQAVILKLQQLPQQ